MTVSRPSMQEADALEHTKDKFHIFTSMVSWSTYTLQPKDIPKKN